MRPLFFPIALNYERADGVAYRGLPAFAFALPGRQRLSLFGVEPPTES